MVTYGNILKRILHTNKAKRKFKNIKHSEQYKIDTIYSDKTVKDFNTVFGWTHYFFKAKIVVPLILLIEKCCSKYIVREYKTNKWHNKPLQDFDEAYESALKLWTKYLKTKYPNTKVNKDYKNGLSSIGLLRLMKNTVLTISSHDNVYIEFIGMLQNEMRKQEIHSETGKHLVYSGNKVDGLEYLTYYYLGQALQSKSIKIKKL